MNIRLTVIKEENIHSDAVCNGAGRVKHASPDPGSKVIHIKSSVEGIVCNGFNLPLFALIREPLITIMRGSMRFEAAARLSATGVDIRQRTCSPPPTALGKALVCSFNINLLKAIDIH